MYFQLKYLERILRLTYTQLHRLQLPGNDVIKRNNKTKRPKAHFSTPNALKKSIKSENFKSSRRQRQNKVHTHTHTHDFLVIF